LRFRNGKNSFGFLVLRKGRSIGSPRDTEEIKQRMPQALDAQEEFKKIRVLAAESTRMGSQLLAEALAQELQFEVAGIEAQRQSLVETVTHRKPHVLLLSSTLEGSTTLGFEITRQLHSACADTKIILLMDAATPSAVVEAFRCGAQGVFSRTESSKALAKCISSVHQGQVWANSAELRYLLQALREAPSMRMVDFRGEDILSRREHDVVQCVAEGLSNREIAKRLKLTEHTVKNYLCRIFDKLGVSSRVEVVLYAFSLRGMMGPGSVRSPGRGEAATAAPLKPHANSAEVKKPAERAKDLVRRARV
jgi:two-component system, NarL family, nitrate/nitrite response regulator NarL